MFWLFFWMNVAIAAALLWSIRAYRDAFTYRMDVHRVPSLEDAVDEVNAGEHSRAEQEVIVGVTEDDFISLGSAYDAGLAEIAVRGDVAVFLRMNGDGVARAVDLYVTPKARYELSSWSSLAYGPLAPQVHDGVVYAVRSESDVVGGVLGAIEIPSGTFVPLVRAVGTGLSPDIRGVVSMVPVDDGAYYMTGCGFSSCDVFFYDATSRSISAVVLGLDDDPLGALRLYSYDPDSRTLRVLRHAAEGGGGGLDEYDLNVDTGVMTPVAAYSFSGPCGSPTTRPETFCTPADVESSSRYWARTVELGLWAHKGPSYLPSPSVTKCGNLTMDYDARRGRFIGCLSYDVEAAKALFSAPLPDLDAMLNP